MLCACTTTSGSGSVGVTAKSSASSSADFPSSSSSAAPTSATASPSGPATVPTLAAREAQLTAQTNGQSHVIVKIANGYQAAVYDQGGDIYFWYDATPTTSWRQIAQSRYPYDSANGAPDAKVTGRLLYGMSDATFIVHGVFTGDSSGNAVAFTSGSNGWGTIKAERNGNIGPSGAAVNPSNQIGLAYDFSFSGGSLVTEDCPTDRAQAECGSHPIRKVWRWTGHDFRIG